MKKIYYRKSGFTLVELSLVMVIIGLIVTGIIAGQSLARSAKIRSIIYDIGRFETAINAFSVYYDQLPGDMTDATSYWPSCPMTHATVNPCDGNGDGIIKHYYGAPGYWAENMRAWQHMNYAGMLEGSYTGEDNVVSSVTAIPGINIPSGPWSGGFSLDYNSNSLGQRIIFGRQDGANKAATGGIVTQSFAYSFDNKYDDGISYEGRVHISGSGCISGSYGGNYISISNNTDENCIMHFKLD